MNLEGQTIYKLTVEKQEKSANGRSPLLTAKCSCGNVITFKGATALRKAKDCGCGAYKYINKPLPQKRHQKPINTPATPSSQSTFKSQLQNAFHRQQKSVPRSPLEDIKIATVDGIKYSYRSSRSGNYFYCSCPLVSLENYFSSLNINAIKKNRGAVLIYVEKNRKSIATRPITILEEFDAVYETDLEKDEAHRFVNTLLTNITIDEIHTKQQAIVKAYKSQVRGTFIHFNIRNSAGIPIGTIAYTFIRKNSLGNARVLLYDNSVHNLTNTYTPQY